MAIIKKNYKLSCVGMDGTGQWCRFTFFVYDANDMDSAKHEVRTGKYRRKVMNQHNLDWRDVELNVVRCNNKGQVAPRDLEKELVIMADEQEQINQLQWNHKYRNRPWMLEKAKENE